jgi:hypothetical protein
MTHQELSDLIDTLKNQRNLAIKRVNSELAKLATTEIERDDLRRELLRAYSEISELKMQLRKGIHEENFIGPDNGAESDGVGT